MSPRGHDPTVWSALEYGCHIRDVHRIFNDRVRLMLTEDEPRFANWDQDATAIEDDYGSQDPVSRRRRNSSMRPTRWPTPMTHVPARRVVAARVAQQRQ